MGVFYGSMRGTSKPYVEGLTDVDLHPTLDNLPRTMSGFVKTRAETDNKIVYERSYVTAFVHGKEEYSTIKVNVSYYGSTGFFRAGSETTQDPEKITETLHTELEKKARELEKKRTKSTKSRKAERHDIDHGDRLSCPSF